MSDIKDYGTRDAEIPVSLGTLFRLKPVKIVFCSACVFYSAAGYCANFYENTFSQLKTDYSLLTGSLNCAGSSCTISGDLDLEPTSSTYDGLRLFAEGPVYGSNATLLLNDGNINFRATEETYVRAGYSKVNDDNATAEGNSIVVGSLSSTPTVRGKRFYVGHAHVEHSSSGNEIARASNNEFSLIQGSLQAQYIIGGYAESAATAEASGNQVFLDGGTLGCTDEYTPSVYVYGGYAESEGPYAVQVLANDNLVSLNNVTVSPANSLLSLSLIGGYAEDDNDNLLASNNQVIIDDVNLSAVSTFIYPAFLNIDNYGQASGNALYLGSLANAGAVEVRVVNVKHGDSDCAVDVTDNSLYLYDNADLSNASSSLYGVYVNDVDSVAYTVNSARNNLYFGYYNTPWSSANNTINRVSGFNTIKFNETLWGRTITITNFAGSMGTDGRYTGITYLDASKVVFSGVISLKNGDAYDMLKVENPITSGSLALQSEKSTYYIGTAVEGEGVVSAKDSDSDGKIDTVTYTVVTTDDTPSDGGQSAPQTHAVVMASSAATLTLNQAADTLSEITGSVSQAKDSGVQAFSAIGGGALRVKTGSHINVNVANVVAGALYNFVNDGTVWSVGGGFEAGYAGFRSHYDAKSSDPFVRKKGHVSYYGVALLSRLQLDNLWHFETSARIGRVFTTQRDALYDWDLGRTYNANINSHYLGVELGLGKVITFGAGNSLDLYGRYYYLYQSSDDFNAGIDRYKNTSINSHRLRLAGCFSHEFASGSSFYASLGVEREFDGKAELKINSSIGTLSSRPSEIDGTRGLLELGLRGKPVSTGLNYDLGIKGMYGNRYRGIFVNAQLSYLF
ncbi:MAG: autotransporter outer membrane beta-barrel domain-containing protein [Succinivibrio sp.]|nr:autotransporter outer membrane beta-barrel domain-containing protein [Succinivibrio sp.]